MRNLDIETEFAMLGASNPVMIRGSLPRQKQEILSALDYVIEEIGESRLRDYRANLKRL